MATARRGQASLRGHCVPIDEHSYIPVPPEVLRTKLGQRLEEKAREEWHDVCTSLQELVAEELRELRSSLSDSYQPFDPARRRWVGSWPLPDKEERFARQFLRAASLAGFTPLSRFDLEKTRELKADLLSLPVTINWDRLDSRWIETLLSEGEEAVPEGLRDFGGYVLALKRGLAVDRCSGRLLIQKLECLQSQWLLSVGSLLQSLLRKISSLSVKAWRTVLPAARGWAESRRGKAVQQKLRHVKAIGLRGVHLAKLLWEAGRSIRMRISGMQVLRRLQPSSYRYAQWLFGDVLNERWSTERAALIKRLARAWEQEVALRGQSRHVPVTAEVWAAAKEQGNFLERVAVEHVTSFSLTTLLQHAELQEPQFQEILVAYRLKGDTDSDYQPPPRRQICVRRFFEVAMKDIKLVLPQEAWCVRGRPLDMIRVDLLTMVGLLSVFSHLLANTNKWLAAVPVVLLSARTIANYRRVKVGSKSQIASMLFDHCLDKDAALMRLLPDAAEAQVFSECALAYWSLLVACAEAPEDCPTICREELSQRGAEVVRQLVNEVDLPEAGISPDFEAAFRRLAHWGLVKVQEDGLQLVQTERQKSTLAAGGDSWEGM